MTDLTKYTVELKFEIQFWHLALTLVGIVVLSCLLSLLWKCISCCNACKSGNNAQVLYVPTPMPRRNRKKNRANIPTSAQDPVVEG